MEGEERVVIHVDKTPRPFYAPINKLGEGAYARVIRAEHKETKKEVAIKIISTAKLSYKDLERAQREVNIVSQLNHPNITKVYEIYQDRAARQTHIIQELLGGGNFLDFILNNGPLSEPEASKLLKGVLLAVQYMHSLGFAHRDLKPENLVLDTEHTILKLIDFGFSKSKNDMYGLETPIGTPGWSPLDVMKGQPYSLAVDMWSIGCIVYFALFAVPPFNSEKTLMSEKINELNQLVKIGTYSWPTDIEISDTAKEFISRLLERDPNVRMSATQALEHAWMNKKPLSTSQKIKVESQPRLNTEEKELLRQTINTAIDRARESADEKAQNEVDAEVGGLQLEADINLDNYIPQ